MCKDASLNLTMWEWIFNITNITTVLVFLLTLFLVYLNTRRSPLLPPGPNLWPIIGNLPSLTGDPVAALESLRPKYGDVIGLYIGSELTVFVNGYEAIHEVLVKRGSLFSWRPMAPFYQRFVRIRYIIFGNGDQFKVNKKGTQTIMNKVCFNNQSLGVEEKITKELVCFIDKLKKIGETTAIVTDINLSVANTMLSVLHGSRPGYDDSRLLRYSETMNRAIKSFRNQQLVHDCFPFILRFIYGSQEQQNKSHDSLVDYWQTNCLNNYDSYVQGQEDCFVHHLITLHGAKDKKDWENILSNEADYVWQMMHDMMAAGIETTATTIAWIVLFMVREPEVQKKARDEIDKVIDKTELPALKHRKHLSYIEALVLEGLRLGQIAPFGVPHSNAQDVNIRGYHIPQLTNILVNLASVSRDPSIFPEPDVFKPERFLSEDGTVVVPKEFIPFSKGPRSCVGEPLARIELFLYTTTLLQKFEFVSPDNCTRPEVAGELGITYAPKPFKLKIVPR